MKKLRKRGRAPSICTPVTTGTGDMTNLMAAQAGVDIVTAPCPLGQRHFPSLPPKVWCHLRGTSRDTGLDMNKLVEAAAHFRDVAQKLDINPKVLKVDEHPAVPGARRHAVQPGSPS